MLTSGYLVNLVQLAGNGKHHKVGLKGGKRARIGNRACVDALGRPCSCKRPFPQLVDRSQER